MSSIDYDGATIEVINWSEYNPRTDSKRPSWFRFENTMATGAAFFDLDCEQKWLWVVILSLTSQANGAPIVWKSSFVRNNSGVSRGKQFQTLEIFEKFGILRVSRNVTLRDSPATNERTNERTLSDFDFEILYSKYPRKQGKSSGIKICASQIKTQASYESLSKAIDRYRVFLEKEKTEPKFIKHFSTFMNSWKDWDIPQPEILTLTQEQIDRRAEIELIKKRALEPYNNIQPPSHPVEIMRAKAQQQSAT